MKILTQKNKCIYCKKYNADIINEGKDYQYQTTEKSFNWVKCRACLHLFVDPIPAIKALPHIYPSTIKNYAGDRNNSIAFKVKELLESHSYRKIVNKLPSTNISFLDIGCADGTLMDTFKKNFRSITRIEGLDISEDATRIVSKKGYRAHIGTVESIKLPKNSYDLIIMQQVIEHLHDPIKAIKNIHKILNKNGILIIETPLPYSIDNFIFKGFWEGYHIPRHFNLWTKDNMIKMLEKEGYKLIEFKKIIKPIHWTISIQNYLIDKKLPRSIIKFFDITSRLPIPLILFTMVDLALLTFFRTASGARYVVAKQL